MQKVGDESWESPRACHACAMFIQWSEAYQDVSSKVRGKLLHLELPNTKKKSQ